MKILCNACKRCVEYKIAQYENWLVVFTRGRIMGKQSKWDKDRFTRVKHYCPHCMTTIITRLGN